LDIRDEGAIVSISNNGLEQKLDVTTNWRPGQSLANLSIDGEAMALKVTRETTGYGVRFRGGDMDVNVFSPRQAELCAHMIEKVAPDTSKLLLCPMPGLVVSIVVSEGDEVQEGQALAVISAMKMENTLRAEKKSVVSKINVSAGDSLAVDEVIMEFGHD
jgi:propionyl-CoA carboxylase alpha chain